MIRKNSEIYISKVLHEIKLSNLTYFSDKGILNNIENCIQEILRKRMSGMFTEFGINLRGSAIIITKLMQTGRIFRGYDLFETIIPSPSEKDDKKSKFRYEIIKSRNSKGINGEIYYGYIHNLSEKAIENFKKFSLEVDDKKCIFLHKCIFKETIIFIHKDQIVLAYIDYDWYKIVKLCLSKIYPIISGVCYIVIDDYYDYGGYRKVVNEFLEKTL